MITIYEVGPRDGLQNEAKIIPTPQKVALIDQLSEIGFSHIEATSFVSPKWIPQLSDAAQVMARIKRRLETRYAALAPNMKGFEAAHASFTDEIAIFAAASESFSQKNINCSIDESFARFAPIAEAAQNAGLSLRGYVSCVTDCPYEGPTDPDRVADVAQRLVAMGCREVSLGETLGKAQGSQVTAMLDAVLQSVPAAQLAGHFHDTAGRALSHIDLCLSRDITVFDAAIGGLGGCPYAPGAAGNVATEKLVQHLHAQGHETGLDLERLMQIAQDARNLVQKEMI